MDFDPADVRPSVFYQQMIHCIVPRPIAWVSTVSNDGVTNVAPFSYFTGVGSRPPSLLFCPANNRQGEPKDTLRNIQDTGDFVVNIVSFTVAEAMNASAAALPPGESEFDSCGVTAVASVRITAPRVLESPVQFECRKMHVLNIGDGPGGANIVVGEVVHVHIDDKVIGARDLVDPQLLDAVGRMGGVSYCRTNNRFDLPRPGE
ncbi:MAG: flavin reductase family protein [Fuerstiella sp.]|nr:flavin reductase family protein [Fuerstiella sp.]